MHKDSFRLQTITAFNKKFLRGDQGGSFFKKRPLGRRRERKKGQARIDQNRHRGNEGACPLVYPVIYLYRGVDRLRINWKFDIKEKAGKIENSKQIVKKKQKIWYNSNHEVNNDEDTID